MTQSAFVATPSPGDAFRMFTVRTLNFTAMNDAFEQGKRAYLGRDYDAAVQHYTSALAAIQTELSSVIFVHRAAAYEMQSKFDQAVSDARSANLCGNPTRPDSYLSLGNALFLHNQLCESAAAYKNGADIVPETCSQHGILLAKHRQTLDIIERRNRFMVQSLPFEVLSRILSMISIKDRARFGMTCRFLNNYIFKTWPYMWETIDTRTDMPNYPDDNDKSFIDAIHGDQVRNVSLEFAEPKERRSNHRHRDEYVSDEYDSDEYNSEESDRNMSSSSDSEAYWDDDDMPKDAGGAILDVMCGWYSDPWKNIRTLALKDCNEEYFKCISKVVKGSLCELTFNDSKKHNNYCKDMIATAATRFPNLQIISNTLDTRKDPLFQPENYITDTANVFHFKLTALTMSWYIGSFSFTNICKHLPALTSLTIDPNKHDDYMNVLNAVINHCPALEHFHYTNHTFKRTTIISTTYTPESSTCTHSGLKTLVFHPVTTSRYARGSLDINPQLASLFQRGSRALQVLDLGVDVLEDTGYACFETLAQLGAPLLYKLALVAYNDTSIGSETIAKLISSSPSLSIIKTSGLRLGCISNLLDALTAPSSIQEINIDFQQHSPEERLSVSTENGTEGLSTSSVASYFNRTRRLLYFSLSCSSHVSFTPTTPFILGLTQAVGSSTIRNLNLQSYNLTNEQLLGTLKNLEHSQVQTLRIGIESEGIGDMELYALASMQHLSHLIVYDDHYCFHEGVVCRLLQIWGKPQMLLVEVRSTDPKYFIRGYTPDATTRTRAMKHQISDLMLRYSIQSSRRL